MASCRSEIAIADTRRCNWLIAAVATSALTLSAAVANAAMHDAETCRKLKTEHDSMNASGLREMLAKGPDWAKSNLTKERMEQIKRFLALEEDVRFRCPLGKARPELEAAESEAGATTALQPGETAPNAPPAPTSATVKPARKAKPQAKAANSELEAQGNGPAGTAAAPKPAVAVPAKAAAKKQPTSNAAPAAPDAGAALQEDGAADTMRKKPR